MDLKNKNVTIIGLGRSGIACVRLLHKLGANIFVSEEKKISKIKAQLNQLKGINFELETGAHTRLVYKNKDLIVLSPGVSIEHPVIKEAKEKKIPVISEVELAYRLTDSPIVAVTGTNGKSTTTSLIYEILKKGNAHTVLGGNIGISLADVIENTARKGFIVSEISTFQLEGIVDFKPHIAVLLNITPDHLDRHHSLSDYVKVKSRIFLNQTKKDYAVINYDDKICRKMTANIKARKYFFSINKKLKQGAYLKNGVIYFSKNGAEKSICKKNIISLKGAHNIYNGLAAVCVACILNIKPAGIVSVLKNFKTLHHRLEHTAVIKGVEFIDDSKGTNPDSVIVALKSFPKKLILIAGGKDKNADFTELAKVIAQKVKNLILIGETASQIESAVKKSAKKSLKSGGLKIKRADSFKKAVDFSFKTASEGDIVLLSPACASFDMFNSAEERGEIFQKLVKDLGA